VDKIGQIYVSVFKNANMDAKITKEAKKAVKRKTNSEKDVKAKTSKPSDDIELTLAESMNLLDDTQGEHHSSSAQAATTSKQGNKKKKTVVSNILQIRSQKCFSKSKKKSHSHCKKLHCA